MSEPRFADIDAIITRARAAARLQKDQGGYWAAEEFESIAKALENIVYGPLDEYGAAELLADLLARGSIDPGP